MQVRDFCRVGARGSFLVHSVGAWGSLLVHSVGAKGSLLGGGQPYLNLFKPIPILEAEGVIGLNRF